MTKLEPKQSEDLGIGLKPGDRHYRAYVGPPDNYDLVAAMTFNLMTTLGLRQHHSLLDIGCGSLRNGRLFIPYLNADRYVGIDPNEWLIREGVQREVGEDLVRIKKPRFCFSDSPDDLDPDLRFDFAVAQSIFSHAGLDLIGRWLRAIEARFEETGAFAATFLTGAADFEGTGWVYPACVQFRPRSLGSLARETGFRFRLLDWRHPRQTWALFSRKGYDTSWLDDGPLGWNLMMDSGRQGPRGQLVGR